MRERLIVSLADGGATFHPRRLDTGDWEFRLARRRFLSIGEISFNGEGERKLAHAIYSWRWTAELLGQLLQVSEEPVNAQASFVWRDGAWHIRDVGF